MHRNKQESIGTTKGAVGAHWVERYSRMPLIHPSFCPRECTDRLHFLACGLRVSGIHIWMSCRLLTSRTHNRFSRDETRAHYS